MCVRVCVCLWVCFGGGASDFGCSTASPLDEEAPSTKTHISTSPLPPPPKNKKHKGDGRVSFEEFLQYLHTDDADELDLFPSRRQRKGAKRRALSVAEERRAASPTSGGGGGGVVEN